MDIKKISELDTTTIVSALLMLVETSNGMGGKVTVDELKDYMNDHKHTWKDISDKNSATINTTGTITGSKVYNAVFS